MKTKKFDKKLALNKKTIADLSNGEMGKIQGGGYDTALSHCLACMETNYSRCLTQCPPGGAGC
ncbi:MAG: class I lanthipeptide [Candidatus Aminicenantes bacterium]|nr:class I lanthipeptide [Candidatus Aminicenantes bacterium]